MDTDRPRPLQPSPHVRLRRELAWLVPVTGALATALGVARLLAPRDGLIESDEVDVKEYFQPDDIARARAFGRPQLALHAASGLIRTAALVSLARRPVPRALRGHPIAGAVGGAAALTLSLTAAGLPLDAWARRRSVAYGLATQSWGDWARDLLKSLAIEVPLTGAGAGALVAIMRRYPRSWWLLASGASSAGAIVFAFLGPVVLDPIFNRFTPLPEGPLRSAVRELAVRAGVRVREIYTVDASRRTTAANAYVTGLGHTKRVVLFDTLLESFTEQETLLVVAHEFAHVSHRDVPRSLGQMALSAPAGGYATWRLMRRIHPQLAREPANVSALPALALAVGAVGALLAPVGAALSRRVEARADAFSLRLTDQPQPFIAFERRIVKQNLADPAPWRWLTALIATHPSTVQRIGIALAYARGVR